jgi:hypothetical protein
VVAVVIGTWALAALAAAPSSRIVMMIRVGRSTKSFDATTVSFDHTTIGRGRLHGPQPASAGEVTVVVPASAATQTAFKLNSTLGKVDLVLYAMDAAGHQHLRSQVEIGGPLVAAYKLSEDKKTATVRLTAKAIFVTEGFQTGNADWVAGG